MSQRLELRRLARDSLYSLVRQGWTLVLGLLISVLLARGLGKTDRGIYTLVLLLPEIIVTFLNLGVYPATVFYIGNKKISTVTAIRENIGLSLWITLLCTIIGVGIIVLFPEQLFPDVPATYLYLSLIVIPITLVTVNLNAVFQGLEDFRTFNAIGMISQLALLIFVGLFVWVFNWKLIGAVIAYLISNWIGLIALIIFLKKKVSPSIAITMRINISYIRGIVGYSLKTHLTNIISFLNYRVDNFILNLISGASFVGLYSVSVGLSERLWILSSAIGSVIFARIATLDDGDLRREQITPITTRFVFWLSAIIAGISAPILIFAIPLLYSSDFTGSIQPLLILLPGTVAFNLGRVLSSDIAGRGKPEVNLIQSSIALIVNIAMNLILIPRFNASGAALASTISYTVWSILLTYVYIRLSGVSLVNILIIQKSDLQRLTKYIQSRYALYQSRYTNPDHLHTNR